MDKFEKGVPFDPGYSQLSYSFIDNINYITREYKQLKTTHQKVFKLRLIEPAIIDLIKKCTAFYLGCILWGSFIHHRFRDNPKEILDNNTEGLTEEDFKENDCAFESNFIIKYIEQFDRDCKYFLKKPARLPDSIIEILKSYDEFVKLNNNFLDIKLTSEVKLPKSVDHFKNLSNKQLDNLYAQISAVIDSGKLEDLLEIGFYKIK